jgi:hypothetical protein
MMKNIKYYVPLMVLMVFLAGSFAAFANEENLDDAAKARIAKAEQGPSTIDVSNYPQKLQDIYTDVFSQKCMQCHRLSRPINSDFVLPSEWESYVKMMSHKAGSGINNGDARKIIEFLIYDSSVRKKAQLEDKLSKVSADAKAAEEAKIKSVHDKYDQK